MRVNAVRRQQRSLIHRLNRGLLFPIALLILGLLLSFSVSVFASVSQYNLGEQKVAIRGSLSGILSSMIDQETGLRGYMNTNNSTFLEPFNSGRPQYLSYLQQLKNETQGNTFANTSLLLAQTDERASNWYNNFALVQIRNMESGNLALARSESTSATGKALFDGFRTAEAQLQAATDRDLSNLQSQVNLINYSSIILVILLSVIVVFLLLRTFRTLTTNLQNELAVLKTATTRLGSGDFSTRVNTLHHDELNQLGQTFNTMSAALQEQQIAAQERDILENVLQLNSILATSLDLNSLTQEFIRNILSSLGLQLGALYLYDPFERQLHLFAVQGKSLQDMQSNFQLGEGLVGQVAQSGKPLYLTHRDRGDKESFSIKTMLGSVLPAGLYHLPLLRGKNLLGVLVVGSVYPMSEKARNVLNVVASTLSAAISNTQSYRRIQEQAEELEKRSREQEAANVALRRQRDDLTVLNAALEDANEARSQFLSTMSHELRTPLTSILGFGQILLRSSDSGNFTSRQKSNIERIVKNGQHLLSLINDVLDLAKIEAGRMDVSNSQVHLKELIPSLVEETQSIAAERGLALEWSIEDGITSIETDPLKLRQILLNLISNALKFTEQGKITVTATRSTPSQPVQFPLDTDSIADTTNESSEQIAIAVSDTGIGISQEMQERIFEAFYQVDGSNTRKYSGTGLGLSIVRQLTTLMGGTLELRSELHQGSTFTLYLPVHVRPLRVEQQKLRLNSGALSSLSNPTTMSVPEALLDTSEQGAQQRVILAVDDNPDVLNLINNALEDSSYTVIGVNDPTKVVEMVQTLHPSAVTLDVMMPDMNGWQLLHQLRSDPGTANVPIIMLTVLEDRSAAHVLGADDYLVKPVNRDTLLNTLRHVAAHQPYATAELRILPRASNETSSSTTEQDKTSEQAE